MIREKKKKKCVSEARTRPLLHTRPPARSSFCAELLSWLAGWLAGWLASTACSGGGVELFRAAAEGGGGGGLSNRPPG